MVKQDGMCLTYASEDLKQDSELVLLAISEKIEALEFASSHLKNDPNFMCTAVKLNKKAL